MTDLSGVLATIDPYSNVDKTAAEKLAGQYRTDLGQTRGALSGLQTQRQDVTTRNLQAIDEAITGIKNSRTTGMLALDPAVSASLAAGFLKTTPGVAGNFLGELGNAMGAAAPVIGNKQQRDRDAFALLAELHRKRGEYEAQPIIEQQKALEEREKAQETGLRTVEAAGLRGTTQGDRDKLKADAKAEADRNKLMEAIQNNARADVEMIRKNKEDIAAPDLELLHRYYQNQRIAEHNRNATAGVPQLVPPQMTQEDKDRVSGILKASNEKGLDEARSKAFKEIRQQTEQRVPKNFGTEIWNNLTPQHQQALIDEALAKEVEKHNANITDPNKKLIPPAASVEDAAAARAAAHATRNIGTPDEKEIARAGLPVADVPNAYAGMTYEARKKAIDEATNHFNTNIKDQRASAAELAKRKEQANDAWAAYNASGRTGNLGAITSLGSDKAQEFDKIVNEMQLTNFPKGQGAVSEGERSIIKNAGPIRTLQPEALKVILDTYVASGQRANDEVAFKEAWFKTHKTEMGATAAWNRYINSPEGMLMIAKDNRTGQIITQPRDAPLNMKQVSIMQNPARMSWQEYFKRENEGGAAPQAGQTWDPSLNGGRGGFR